MIAVLIVVILIIAILGAVVYSGMTAMSTIESSSLTQQNIAQGEKLVQLIENHLRVVDDTNELRAPMGQRYDTVASDGWTTVPAWITTHYNNASGIPFLYCPFSVNTPSVATNSTVYDGDNSAAYNVVTVNNEASEFEDYVVASDINVGNSGNLLFVLATPIGSKTTMPNCTDLSYSDGVYTLPGTRVWAVTKEMAGNVSEAAQKVVHVAPDGAASLSTSDGSGSSFDNPMTLNSALSLFKARPVARIKVKLGAGTYTVNNDGLFKFSGDDLAASSGSHSWRTLEIKGSGSGSTAVVSDGVVSDIDFSMKGISLVLEDLTYQGDIYVDGGRVDIKDAVIQGIDARRGSRIFLNNITSQNNLSYDSTVWIGAFDSLVVSKGDISAAGAIYLDNSDYTVDGGSLNLSSSSASQVILKNDSLFKSLGAALSVVNNGGATMGYGFYNDASSLVLDGGSLRFDGLYQTLINNAGSLVLSGHSLQLKSASSAGVGIDLLEGGFTKINSSEIFNPVSSNTKPDRAFKDSGGLGVSGDTSTFYGSVGCWTGPLFSSSSSSDSSPVYSPVNVLAEDGVTTIPVDLDYNANSRLNNSDWICAF